MAEKILEGDQIDLIKKTVIVRKYKDDAAEGFKGKSYRIYAYGKEAFAVHEDDDFHQDLKIGNVFKVLMTVSDEGWSLANYITWDKAEARKVRQTRYDNIANVKPEPVSEGLYNSIS